MLIATQRKAHEHYDNTQNKPHYFFAFHKL